MRRPSGVNILFAAVLLIATSAATAQQDQSPFEGKKVVGFGQPGSDKLQVARRLMSSLRYQEAADLLETVYQTDPDNEQIQNLLRTCYDLSKQYQKAELLARKMIEKQPANFGLRVYLAETLVRMTRIGDALTEYDKAAATFERSGPTEAASYLRSLVRSLVNSDLDSVALVRIDQARVKFGNSILLAADRGGILEKRQQYREAVREYLPPLLQDTTIESLQAEKRLSAMLEFEGSSAEVEQLVKAVADSTASVRLMTLLSDHFLKAGRFDEAFLYCLKQDSLEGASGIPLVMFARSCQERHCWAEVVRMTDIIMQRHSENEFVADASFQKAHALAELGRPLEAAEVYRQLAARSENPQIRGDATYGLGVLYSEYLHDYGNALIQYDSVITHYPRGQRLIMARKEVPLCHLRLGQTSEARTLLANLLQSRLPDELQEEVFYLTGLTEFFDKKYDTAEAIFRKLIVDYPRGFYVNDALSLVLTMGDAKSPGTALDEYSGARFAAFRGKLDTARTCFAALAGAQPSVLGDLALYELTRLELNGADSSSAIKFIDRLDKEHPDSYYRPLGLKLKADLLAQPGHDLKQAMELYRVLLESYSEYPFVREVREKLRDLDSRVPAS